MRVLLYALAITSLVLIVACNQIRDGELQWNVQTSGIDGSCRGLSVVSDQIVWVSGQNGSFALTTDGGENWKTGIVPGADSLDFRDVEGFSDSTAYLLAAGPGEQSRIYKTIDGGDTWKLQFTNKAPEGFYCAFAFWDETDGIAFSDPVDGRFRILRTVDGGASWDILPANQSPQAIEGEYAFAASGTCIVSRGKGQVWIGTGGKTARVLYSTDRGDTWNVATTPFVSGEASTGIFSLAFQDSLIGIATGGDYQQPSNSKNNVAVTRDGGKTWTLVDELNQLAYRSCVRYLPGNPDQLLAVGRNGSDKSLDGGKTWSAVDTVGYYVLDFAPDKQIGWVAGKDGRISKITVH